ncbi:MAG: hypothetical protein WA705_30320, partial [Candidatus Ozemobacteraceae bacterium]
MKHPLRYLFLFSFMNFFIANAGAESMYKLNLVLDPNSHFLKVQGSISGLTKDFKPYLNGGFKIESLGTSEKPISYFFNLEGKSPPYVDIGKPISLNESPPILDFVYSGKIENTISDVNLISSDLVELSIYSAWYPFCPNLKQFSYELTVTLPAEYNVITSGELLYRKRNGSQQTLKFSFLGNTTDIPLIASKNFVPYRISHGKMTIEMWTTDGDQKFMDRQIANMAEALTSYESLYGKSALSGVMKFVYSPRNGWGYSRLPLFVVSEQR